MKKVFLVLGLTLGTIAYAGNSISDYGNELTTSIDFEAKGRFKEAIQVLEKANAKDPSSYALNIRLGYLYSTTGLTANAIEYFSRALKLQPQSLEAQAGLINAYAAKAQWSEVEKTSNAMLSIDKFNYTAAWNQVRAQIMLGKFDEGLKIAEKFLNYYPTDQTLLVQRAVCLGYLKNNHEAIRAYKDVQALYPANPTAKEGLKALK